MRTVYRVIVFEDEYDGYCSAELLRYQVWPNGQVQSSTRLKLIGFTEPDRRQNDLMNRWIAHNKRLEQ